MSVESAKWSFSRSEGGKTCEPSLERLHYMHRQPMDESESKAADSRRTAFGMVVQDSVAVMGTLLH